ncbi:MAG: hypothetical protein LBH28_04910 [Oscillospiraceae bacterium]|jgi:hypothetical protein|nr:hypothetical protein [Oscillospiraceae bacterium]
MVFLAVAQFFPFLFIFYAIALKDRFSILIYPDIMCPMGKKKGKQLNLGQVVIPTNHPNPPEQHEIDAAWILARHFQCVVEFLTPVDDYMRKTADIVMLGVQWEMKSPIGASKATIENQFRRASKQSRSLIIDTRRTTLDDKEIVKSIIRETKKHSSIKRVILIDKFDKVIEMSI